MPASSGSTMRASLWASTTLSISLTRVGEPRRPSASRSAASASWSHWTTLARQTGLPSRPIMHTSASSLSGSR